ncbi:hypothetical protein [Paraflavitalea pollutisoli]|uniref:hypothetical protein n=1 Tax=Paraflavitalea pollutisoli TaxID=3034143 RepID=UPI0023EC2875|nr:hypothetical protein [Paraflavitalea sp. H1-2-19X]
MPKRNQNVHTALLIRRLNPKDISQPANVITEFFTNYHLQDLREALWEWLVTGLTSTNNYQNGSSRSNLIFLYDQLEKLIEAIYLQNSRARKSTSTKPVTKPFKRTIKS